MQEARSAPWQAENEHRSDRLHSRDFGITPAVFENGAQPAQIVSQHLDRALAPYRRQVTLAHQRIAHCRETRLYTRKVRVRQLDTIEEHSGNISSSPRHQVNLTKVNLRRRIFQPPLVMRHSSS